jgi:hypothetical protein
MRTLFLFVVASLLWAQPLAVRAVEFGAVAIQVEDRSAQTRREALEAGLEQVLVRLTGRVEADAETRVLLEGDPSRWVLQYGYEERAGERDEQTEQDSAPTLWLTARFDVQALAQRLTSAGAQVWPLERPPVLVWLVDQGAARGDILARGAEQPLMDALNEAARRRGVTLLLPEMDGTDRSRIQAADIRGQFEAPLASASQRYGAAFVVSAVLYRGAEPRLRWRLSQQGEVLDRGQTTLPSADQAVAVLVDRIADQLVSLYAISSQQVSPVQIDVSDLRRLQDWHALKTWLGDLAGMESLSLVSLRQDNALFEARFAGSAEKLERLAGLYPHLGRCPVDKAPIADSDAPQPMASAAPRLRFCWRSQPDA